MRLPARIAALTAALAVVSAGLLSSQPAAAATTPPPPTAAASVRVVTSCVPSDTVACVAGTLRATNGVVPGVSVSLTPASGAGATANSDKNGQFKFEVTSAGPYTLALDPGTLPTGVKASVTTRKLTLSLGSLQAAAFGLTGTVKGGAVTPTAGPSFLQQVGSQASLGLLLGLLLALASIGLSLVYGTTGLSNFAHAEQVTLGGLLAYVFIGLGVPFLLAAVISIALCAASGAVQDRLIWQPLRKRGLGLTQLMVVTIGLQLALEYTFQYVFGGGVLNINQDIQLQTGPLSLTPDAYLSMLISILVLVAVGLALTRTRIGRATRAVADNRALAAASGIDVDGIIRLVWTIATGLAGLAGILYAVVYGGVRWNTGAELLLLIFAAVTLGGLGTAFGALVGSLVIGLVVQLSTLVLSSQLKYASALLILILVLIFRPQGILGRRQRVG